MSDPNSRYRSRQYTLIGGGVAVVIALVAAGMFLFDSSETPTAVSRKIQTVQIAQPGTVSDKDEWRALQAQSQKTNETMITELRGKLNQQAEDAKKLAKELDEFKNRKPEGRQSNIAVLNAPLPLALPLAAPLDPTGGKRTLTPPTLLPKATGVTLLSQPLGGLAEVPKREVEIIQFNKASGKPGTPASADPVVLGFPVNEKSRQYSLAGGGGEGAGANEFIPAGAFVRVAMLNGIDAPTGGQAQSNPLPVAFHVLDVASLPNKYQLDIRDCRVIGAAYGDLSSERTMIRTETMSCILGDGETIEMQVKGQAIGEDGKAGLRGRLVSKQGALLANALFGGALSGIGKAFQQSATTSTTSGLGVTQTIDPAQVSKAALGGGLSTAASQLAEYYLKAADKLFPILETDGGRVIELLITKGVVFPGKRRADINYRALLTRGASNGRDADD